MLLASQFHLQQGLRRADERGMAGAGECAQRHLIGIQAAVQVEGGGIRVIGTDARRAEAGGVRHLVGVVHTAEATIFPQQRLAGDVADAGAKRDA